MGNPQCPFGVRETTYFGTCYQRPGLLANVVLAGTGLKNKDRSFVWVEHTATGPSA